MAYSESPEVRQAVDPVLSVVSEPAQAVGKSAGKVAVGAGKLALATGKYVGHQTVASASLQDTTRCRRARWSVLAWARPRWRLG